MAHTERDLETPRLWLRPMLADRQRIPALPNKRVEPTSLHAERDRRDFGSWFRLDSIGAALLKRKALAR